MIPLVSVGLPFFNPGIFFHDAVRSVFAQTHQDWELILMDDGSTDGSLAKARQIQSDRVRVFSDGCTRGLPLRLNEIAELARGRYLARMDADDMMHPERLERQLSLIPQEDEFLVCSAAWIIDNRNNIVGTSRGRDLSASHYDAMEVLKWGGGIYHATFLTSRKWFLRNPYDPSYPRAEDRELLARALSALKILKFSKPLYFYRFAGCVNLEAYLQGYASERKVLSRYGPSLIGPIRTAYLLTRSRVKSVVLRAACATGLQDLAMKRAYRPILPGERDEASCVLDRVISTRVPGWDSTST